MICFVHRFVDPGPVVQERLATLEAEYKSEMEAFDRRAATAAPSERSAIRRELRARERDFRRARWKAQLLRIGIAHW
jgi:hypothetical protein